MTQICRWTTNREQGFKVNFDGAIVAHMGLMGIRAMIHDSKG